MEINQKTTVEILLDENEVLEMVQHYLNHKTSSHSSASKQRAHLAAAKSMDDLEIRAMKGTASIKPEIIRIRFIPEGDK